MCVAERCRRADRTSNGHDSPFSFHFIKRLAIIPTINMEKINEQYVFAISTKRCKNFPRRKTSFGFLRCCFARFSSHHASLLRHRDVTMHPHPDTGDNVPLEIIPLRSISCLVFHTRQDGLLSDVTSRGKEPTLSTLLGNPNHLM